MMNYSDKIKHILIEIVILLFINTIYALVEVLTIYYSIHNVVFSNRERFVLVSES